MNKQPVICILLLLSFSVKSIAQNYNGLSAGEKAKLRGNEDEGITGPVHQQNIGKILFQKYPISRDNMNDPATYHPDYVFVPGDQIFARFFLEKGIDKYPIYDASSTTHENVKEVNGQKEYEGYTLMYIDGKAAFSPQRPASVSHIHGTPDPKNRTNLLVPMTGQIFIRAESDYYAEDIDKDINHVFATISPGLHKIKIEYWLGTFEIHTKEPAATGEFNFNKKATGLTFEKLATGSLSKPDIEAKMLKEMQGVATKGQWKQSFTKAKVTSDDYVIKRNDITGMILGRSLNGSLYAKWPDGHCSYQAFTFFQSYDGSSYQNSLHYDGRGDETACDCSK